MEIMIKLLDNVHVSFHDRHFYWFANLKKKDKKYCGIMGSIYKKLIISSKIH